VTEVAGRHLPLDTFIINRLHPHDIDDPSQIVFSTNGHLYGSSIMPQLRSELRDDSKRIGSSTGRNISQPVRAKSLLTGPSC